ncbi:MAG: FkbM family methyltransferase [Terriglobia bacterium]
MRNFLKRIARQPLVVRVTDGLRIRGLLRGVYRYCFAPKGGMHQISVGGRLAQFHIYSETTVQALDSLGGERGMLEFLMGKLTAGDCCYDIGAATGLYTVFLAQVVGEEGHVVSFEPELDSYGRLRENLKLNNLGNVQPFRLALSDREGNATLQIADVAGAGRIVDASDRGSALGHMEHIKVVHGDRFIESHGLPQPRALKIDVEGHEYSVLQGLNRTLSQPSCKLLCCEIHPGFLPQTLRPEDVLALLRSMGFCEIQIHPRGGDLHAYAFKPN